MSPIGIGSRKWLGRPSALNRDNRGDFHVSEYACNPSVLPGLSQILVIPDRQLPKHTEHKPVPLVLAGYRPLRLCIETQSPGCSLKSEASSNVFDKL